MLHSRQLVIEYHILDLVFLAVIRYLLQLSASYVGGLFRLVESLYEFLVSLCPGGLRQELKFVKIFHYLSVVIVLSDDADKDGFFY